MMAMISAATAALFTSVALLTKHNHWQLEGAETQALAEAINDCINTLPAKYYVAITAILEKWVPWVNLAFVASAIIIPRLEESSKRVEESHYRENPRSDRGNARTEANPFDNYTSLGGS